MKPIGKKWTDKEIIDEGKRRLFKRLQPIGNSYALFLPKIWLEFACKEDKEGNYWVEVLPDANKMTIIGVRELP